MYHLPLCSICSKQGKVIASSVSRYIFIIACRDSICHLCMLRLCMHLDTPTSPLPFSLFPVQNSTEYFKCHFVSGPWNSSISQLGDVESHCRRATSELSYSISCSNVEGDYTRNHRNLNTHL